MTEIILDDNGVLTFPPELIEEMGWKEGDELLFEYEDDGSFTIKKASEAND